MSRIGADKKFYKRSPLSNDKKSLCLYEEMISFQGER